MFIQKWFGALGSQCVPFKYLLPFWSKFFKYGLQYLFKFYLSLMYCLEERLLDCNQQSEITEILTLKESSKYWSKLASNVIDSLTKDKTRYLIKLVVDNQVLQLKHKQEEIRYRFNHFGDVSEENKQTEHDHDGLRVITIDPLTTLSEKYQKTMIDQVSLSKMSSNELTQFGKDLFFGVVFAIADANDATNTAVDTMNLYNERRDVWQKYLKKSVLNGIAYCTIPQMKQEMEFEFEDEFPECDLCDDGFASVSCAECKTNLCNECSLKLSKRKHSP